MKITVGQLRNIIKEEALREAGRKMARRASVPSGPITVVYVRTPETRVQPALKDVEEIHATGTRGELPKIKVKLKGQDYLEEPGWAGVQISPQALTMLPELGWVRKESLGEARGKSKKKEAPLPTDGWQASWTKSHGYAILTHPDAPGTVLRAAPNMVEPGSPDDVKLGVEPREKPVTVTGMVHNIPYEEFSTARSWGR